MTKSLEELLRNVSSVSAKTLDHDEKRYVMLQVSSKDEQWALSCALADLMRHEPDEDGWVKWVGGRTPKEVADVRVEILMRNGERVTYAGHLIDWMHRNSSTDVMAYRPIQENLSSQ